MKTIALATAALLVLPTLGHAHPGASPLDGAASGLAHPLLGVDHLLAVIAVGLWAAQTRGRALWAIPATFLATMALGGALGIAGLPVPFVQAGIITSLLLLGLVVALALRLPLVAAMPLVGLFALFHGAAHGAEMPANASGLGYATGFLLASAALQAGGLALGFGAPRLAGPVALRITGAAIAAVGVGLAMG